VKGEPGSNIKDGVWDLGLNGVPGLIGSKNSPGEDRRQNLFHS
jgi:hypothetical protein